MTQTYPNRSQATGSPDARTGRTNRLAVWSLVLAVLTLGGIGSILGIVLGARARRQMATTEERGSGLALAGVIIGVLTLLVAIGYWIVIARHLGGGTGGGTGGGY